MVDSPSQRLEVQRSSAFAQFWIGQTISQIGSQFSTLAIPLTATYILNVTAFQMGLVQTAQYLPILLVSLIAGVWVDRLRRRPILIVADLGRAALLGLIPLAALLGVLRLEHLLLVVFIAGILTVFFDISYQAFIPFVIDRDHLVEANGKLAISEQTATVVGPSLAGAVIQIVTAPLAIAVDALSFLASAAMLWRIRVVEPSPDPSTRRGIGAEIVEGIRFVQTVPMLRAIAIAGAVTNLFLRMSSSVYVLYATRDLGLTAASLGLVFATLGVGAVGGSLVAARVTRRIGVGPAMSAAVVLLILSAALPPLAGGGLSGAVVLGCGQGLLGFALAILNVSTMSLRQAITPQRVYGRVGACMRVVMQGAMPIGALAGGILGEAAGLRTTLGVVALGMVVVALAVLLSPIPRQRDLSTLPDAS